MNSIYFPLRCNCGWFTDEQTRAELERRIKRSMILYDHLVFQDGRYELMVLENGDYDSFLPSSAIPGNRGEITYYVAGKELTLQVSGPGPEEWHPVLHGPTTAAYSVDFYPILNASGLLGESYVSLSDQVISDNGKRLVADRVRDDQRNEAVLNLIPGNRYLRKRVIQGVYFDSLLAQALQLGMTVDPRVGEIIQCKNHQLAEDVWRPDLAPFVLDALIRLRLPDYGQAEWETVHEVRESYAGRELRRTLHRVTQAIAAELPNLQSREDLVYLTARYLTREMLEELRTFVPGAGDTMFKLGINFLSFAAFPLAGSISALQDLAALATAKRSWVSLFDRSG